MLAMCQGESADRAQRQRREPSVMRAVDVYNQLDSGFCGVITALLWPCNQGESEHATGGAARRGPFVIDGFWGVEKWFPSVGSRLSSAMGLSTAVTDGGQDTRHGVFLVAAASIHTLLCSILCRAAPTPTPTALLPFAFFAPPAPSASLATAQSESSYPVCTVCK